jgi:enoyl-CoA hydratase/carnithine racemase
MPSVVRESEDPRAVTLTLSDPGRGNALSAELSAELESALAAVDEDAPDVLILRAAGVDFCRGGDPDPLPAGIDPWRRLEELPMPVIAAVQGRCCGAGLELALRCDLRLAADDATFVADQVRSGHLPRHGGTWWLPRLVGESAALDMLLGGAPLAADRALLLGLVNTVAADGDLDRVVAESSEAILRQAPLATRFVKQAVREGMGVPLEVGLTLEASLNFILQTSADRKEGLLAARERREPEFHGR